jgi:hypothetical protein
MPSGLDRKISLVTTDASEAGVSAFVIEKPPFLKQFSITFSETRFQDLLPNAVYHEGTYLQLHLYQIHLEYHQVQL